MDLKVTVVLHFALALLSALGANCQIYGDPLYLTPYIQAGQIAEGQAAAKVEGLSSTIESYSGFITVNEEYNSNLFFWFFPARYNSASAPVLIWFQGGPGSSSMFGLFAESGPFSVDSHHRLFVKEVNWAKEFNVIYIDQPVGSGFSFTNDTKGYPTDETQVGADVYQFLLQWFQLFNQFQDNEFYLTGESYAGKYVPAVAYTIYQNNDDAEQKINLKGFAIGDGWIDPIHQLDTGGYLYWNGMIGEAELEVYREIQNAAADLINAGDYGAANYPLGMIGRKMRRKDQGHETRALGNYFFQTTGLLDPYNYLYTLGPSELNYYKEFLAFPWVRKSIHVGTLEYDDESNPAYDALYDDINQSVSPWLSELLNSTQYRIMLYNGQVDIVCPHSLTTDLINYLDWYGAEDFANAERKVWRVDTVQVGGYARTAHNFTQVIVRNSGHYVPYDQPTWCYDMLTRFVNNVDF